MEKVSKTAIILGATGLTGGQLLSMLLDDDRYERVLLFSRSNVGIDHPKITEHLGAITQLDAFEDTFQADEVFCCIGTTKSKTPDKEKYKAIDYGIPLTAAQMCKRRGIGVFIVISALGADPSSSIFYNRVKGLMEKDVLTVGIEKTHVLQPSLIGGQRDEKRFGEWFFKQLMKVLNPLLIGGLAKYRSIHPSDIARSMVWLANRETDKVRIPSDEIYRIAKQ